MRKLFCGLIALLLAALAIPAAQAQRPDAPPYALRGPYAVGTREFVIEDAARPLSVTAWYPALNPDGATEATVYAYGLFRLDGRALRDAAPDTEHGPYPLVIFSHGLGGLRYQSRFFTEHLASYGFVVLAADHPGSALFDLVSGGLDAIIASYADRPFDLLRQIDYAAETLNAPDGALAGVIDTERVAVSGHSFGGYTALAAGGGRLDFTALADWCAAQGVGPDIPPPMGQETGFAEAACFLQAYAEDIALRRGLDGVPDGPWPATTDPRIKAVVLMAPWNGPVFGPAGLAALTAPTMILVGSADRATIPERDAYPIYAGIGSTDKTLVVFENAGHYIFTDECPPAIIALGRFEQCSDLVWDMDRAHDLINHLTTAFLLATLHDDAEAAAALTAGTVEFTGVRYATSGRFGESNFSEGR